MPAGRYRVEFVPAARRSFLALALDVRRRLDPHILALADNPRPAGVVKLTGPDELWRVRVGSYRIVYQIEDRALLVLVFRIAHRREVYR